MMPILPLLSFFITNLPANQLPWNVTVSPDPLQLPQLILQNIPWFFPLITLVSMVMIDYILGLKRGVSTKVQWVTVAIVFTILQYIEVAGGLASSAYFFLFEFLMMISMFVMVIFSGGFQ